MHDRARADKSVALLPNSPGGLVDEPILRERNADSQEEIDPRQETDRRLQLPILPRLTPVSLGHGEARS